MSTKPLTRSLILSAFAASGACRTSTSQTRDSGEPVRPAATGNDQLARTLWSVRMGLTLDQGSGGARIKAVAPATFASGIGLNIGDVITAVNGVKVGSATEFDTVAASFAANSGNAASWDGAWVFTLASANGPRTVQADKSFHCDPYMLVGCGPLRM